MQKIEIISLAKDNLEAVRTFTDRWIGEGYFEAKELEECLDLSQASGLNSSLAALVDGELAGVRITFAPGKWIEKARGASFELWNAPKDRVGYFKSLFVADKFQKRGIGRKLSETSLQTLKEMGAEAVICHSWLESPGNSSQRYLQSMGFEEVKTHPRFWHEIDYLCTRCAPKRCECGAVEMIKRF